MDVFVVEGTDMRCCSYTFGVSKLRSLLSSSDGKTASSYARTLSYIQQCYAGVLVSTVLIVVGAVGIGIVAVQGYKEVNPQGKGNWALSVERRWG